MAADPKIAVNGNRKFNPAQPWRIDDSLDLYNVNAWGKGYFSVNEAGHVIVRPDTQGPNVIDLFEVVEGLKARDLTTPVVVRFSDILAHRLKHIHGAFAQAIAENNYKNRYAAVFPIKVNQQRLVVEEVYRYGKEFGFGLEVGLEARAAGRDGHDRGRAGPADRLQRLQGRQLHRGGDARDQARPHHHPGGREFRGARSHPQARRSLRRAPADRGAGEAVQRGLGPLARLRR